MDDHWDTESGVIYDLLVNRCELIFSKFNKAEEAIKAINSMIESKCLTDIALQIKLLDGVSDKKDYNFIKMTDTENGTAIDLKDAIKKRMQEIIDTL